MKTLIITDSWDVTTDLVIDRLQEQAFRLNTDIIRDYKLKLTDSDFEISGPTGRRICASEISSVYWRKPFSDTAYHDPSHEEFFFYSECRYLIREIYNLCIHRGAYNLVEEGAERRIGKLMQLTLAKEYFSVPEWEIHLGQDEYFAPSWSIAKSLSGEAIDDNHVLYTTRIDGKVLDPRYVWFTQRAIDRTADITVCFVENLIYAFKLDAIIGVTDWRAVLDQPETHRWYSITLSVATETSIREFMKRCALRFGRLDFVLEDDTLYFLEVNPNGQWAWLDLNDEVGLITAMVNAIQGKEISAIPKLQ
jgi:hypothetical protein